MPFLDDIGISRIASGAMVHELKEPAYFSGDPGRNWSSAIDVPIVLKGCGSPALRKPIDAAVSVLVGPAGWEDVTALFAAFSPRNDRLAIVYSGKMPDGKWRTLIDIRDARGSMERLASIPISDNVGYRIGWSQDARHLAAIHSINGDTDALIYAIP